jgi:hypothetical protein
VLKSQTQQLDFLRRLGSLTWSLICNFHTLIVSVRHIICKKTLLVNCRFGKALENRPQITLCIIHLRIRWERKKCRGLNSLNWKGGGFVLAENVGSGEKNYSEKRSRLLAIPSLSNSTGRIIEKTRQLCFISTKNSNFDVLKWAGHPFFIRASVLFTILRRKNRFRHFFRKSMFVRFLLEQNDQGDQMSLWKNRPIHFCQI